MFCYAPPAVADGVWFHYAVLAGFCRLALGFMETYVLMVGYS